MARNAFHKFLVWPFAYIFVCIATNDAWETRTLNMTTKPTPNLSRRALFPMVFFVPLIPSATAQALDSKQSGEQTITSLQQQQYANRPFVSAAFIRKELSNSIVASRDTNISPVEVYETILRLKKQGLDIKGSESHGDSYAARALDVGAGAGVSTQVIFHELGYVNIDAIDWSGDAWRQNVIDNGYCPSSVNFYELDDERFVEKWKKEKLDKYDIIAFNFAVNREKALYFCKYLLNERGFLLAPINTQQDYWLKQTYQLFDADGEVVWSAADVGAWSVQFQPDVTQDTCQGIWCSSFNGFQKLRR